MPASCDPQSQPTELPAAGLLWFEVDLPAMVSAKGLALDALGAQKGTGPGEGARKHPLHVASWRALTADLSGPDWVQALAACGFDPGQPTLWIVEGLFMYLEPRDGTGLLHTMQGELVRWSVGTGRGWEAGERAGTCCQCCSSAAQGAGARHGPARPATLCRRRNVPNPTSQQ